MRGRNTVEDRGDILAVQGARRVLVTPLHEAVKRVLGGARPAGAVGRQIDAVVDDAVEHQRLDVVAVLLEVGRGVEGAVGTGVGDQPVVLAQRLPDLLDVRGRILGREVAIQLAGGRQATLGKGGVGAGECRERVSRKDTIARGRAS